MYFIKIIGEMVSIKLVDKIMCNISSKHGDEADLYMLLAYLLYRFLIVR